MNIKHKSLLASSLALSLAFAANAHAGQITDDFDVSVAVGAACTMGQPVDLEFIYDNSLRNVDASSVSGFWLTCNEGLPYTLEISNTGPGGTLVLTNPDNGDTLTAIMQIAWGTFTTPPDQAPVWGSVANNEHYSGIANGIQGEGGDYFSYAAYFQFGNAVPKVGFYSNEAHVVLGF